MEPKREDPAGGPSVLHPVSAGQHALWLLHQLAPDSGAYNDAIAAKVTPPPDGAALAAAVDFVTQRHDLLRSRFVDDDGVPARIIDAHGPRLEVFDVGDIDDRAMSEVVSAAASERYELANVGTARFRLYRRLDTDAVLLSGNHHIATDAASQFVLWRDLLIAYGALTRGESPNFPRWTGPGTTRWRPNSGAWPVRRVHAGRSTGGPPAATYRPPSFRWTDSGLRGLVFGAPPSPQRCRSTSCTSCAAAR